MTEQFKLDEAGQQQLAVLAANTVDLLPREEFARKLAKSIATNTPLRVKYGADPTAPDLHLGHSVVIRKLRQFQDYGHTVVFIVGDYTARVGDPSGRNASRPPLDKATVDENAKTYLDQIFRILDRERTEVVYNSHWLESMTTNEILQLMGSYTVSQMLERDDFHRRFEAETPIALHEFVYPLLQGFDSIAVRADIELGGTDQKFNLLVGRDLQRQRGLEAQCILTMPLLVGTDGKNKMSKSLGNYIGISEAPRDMFGKAMSIPDELVWDYHSLALGMTPDAVSALRADTTRHPRDIKDALARSLVEMYHGAEAAAMASDDFRARFATKEFPEATADEANFALAEVATLGKLILALGAAKSGREAQRLVEQRGLVIFDEPEGSALALEGDDLLALLRQPLAAGTYRMRLGKRQFVKVTLV